MKISQLMHRDVITCRTADRLDRVAQLMWEHDIGCVPVVDDEGHLSGMITDRDVCMAAYTQGEPLCAIPVTAAMSRQVFTCAPDDTLAAAEHTMREHQVRRMPVIDAKHHPIGIVSLNDIALASQRGGVTATEVATTLAAICAPRELMAPPAA